MSRASTGGLDFFRPAAALLVAAIHTGPLLSVHPEVNYWITDIIARLAVPFFFAVTGYFLLPRLQAAGGRALLPFGKKLIALYLLACLPYLPILIYNGYFTHPDLPLRLAQDFFLNGLYYHLWYFPAVLLGAVLLCPLVRRARPGLLWGVCAGLYLIGLFGDSYYGLCAGFPPLATLWSGYFAHFGLTRNGLFFAPLFLLLGGTLARRPPHGTSKGYAAGLACSLAALSAEGLMVKAFGLAHFDAMYLTLPLCVWVLLLFLFSLPLPPQPALRAWSAAFYVLHPLSIVLVRGAAKLLDLTGVLVACSPVHYLSVVLCTTFAALPFALYACIRRHHKNATPYTAGVGDHSQKEVFPWNRID